MTGRRWTDRRLSMLAAGLLAATLLAACDPTIEPTFAVIQEQILFPSCGTFDACHGGTEPQAGLDLSTAELSYESLVGIDATETLGVLVVPGDSDNSALYQLLFWGVGEARPMPIGYQLPDEELRAIRDWIRDGAQNN